MKIKICQLLIVCLMATLAVGISALEAAEIKVGGFVATQFTRDSTEGTIDTFKFKNTRVHAIGKLTENIKGFVQIENKTGKTNLQNAYVDLTHLENTEIRIGWIKLPFGIEAYGHPLKNPTISPSKASSKIYRGANDMGFHIKYKGELCTVIGAVVNGNNGKVKDDNDAKDLCGKIMFSPMDGLNVGGSFYSGKTGADELSTQRWGVEANYKQEALWVRAEYLTAKDEQSGGKDIKMDGGYVVVAYRYTPETEWVVRYEIYDPDGDVDDDEYSNTTLGVNRYLTYEGWSRLSLNYELRDDKADKALDNLLTAQVQVLF